MTSNQKNWAVLFSTMLIIGAVAIIILEQYGTNEESVSLVLRLTARVSFLTYLLVFITRPLRQLLKSPLTAKMLKNRRYFGISFAGAHSVHLALIFMFVLDLRDINALYLFGGTAYTLMYLMLITSFNAPAAAIGPVAWRRLHKVGLYGIGATFAYTFITVFVAAPNNPGYQALVVLLIAAIAIRIMAFLKRTPA